MINDDDYKKIDNIDYQLKKVNLEIQQTVLKIKQAELKNSEEERKEKKTDLWFKHAQIIISAISAIAIPVVLGIGINYISAKEEKDKTAADLIQIIGDKDQSLSAKQAALSALNRFNLLDDDVLYDLTYRIDDSHYSTSPIGDSFVKERIKNPTILDYPLGTIDFPKAKDFFIKCRDKCANKYRVAGWAISKNPMKYLSVLIDSKERFKVYFPGVNPDNQSVIQNADKYLLVITEPQHYNDIANNRQLNPVNREDVIRVYDQYKDLKHINPEHIGFDFFIPPEFITDKSHELTIKLTDNEYRTRDIFSRRMCFQESCE